MRNREKCSRESRPTKHAFKASQDNHKNTHNPRVVFRPVRKSRQRKRRIKRKIKTKKHSIQLQIVAGRVLL